MAFGIPLSGFHSLLFTEEMVLINAGTFIALLLAKFYFLHKSARSLSQYMSLPLDWINSSH